MRNLPTPQAILVVMSLLLTAGACRGESPDSPPWVLPPDSGQEASTGMDGGSRCPLSFYTLQTDIANCGGCGLLCDLDNTDRCRGGTCTCGLLGEPCPLGLDCRGGVCLEPDPEGVRCEFDGECQDQVGEIPEGAMVWCIEGRCTAALCVEEVCDGADNDCDGVVDETAENLPLTRWCPSEISFGTLLPPCQLGVQFCREGEWTECLGDSLPRPEIGTLACDGLDNDCDGCTDGVLPSCDPVVNTLYDVVFVVDMSGSMADEQMAVYDALTRFVERFSRPEFRYALVEMPAPPVLGSWHDSYTSALLLNFASYDRFLEELGLIIGLVYGSFEPSWDTVWNLGMEIDLRPSWDPRATRVIIVITDEEGQSWRHLYDPRWILDPNGDVTEEEMCASLSHGEVLAVVNETENWEDFDACATLFELTEDAVTMADALSTIISDPCNPASSP